MAADDSSTLPFVVQDLFPSEEVHLIAGPSGAGKTTWLFQFMAEWIDSKPLYGYQSFSSPWLYIACDRSREATYRTLERIESKLDKSRIFSLVDDHTRMVTADDLLELIKAHLPSGGVVFVDGIGSLVPHGKINDYQAVKDFLIFLTRFCKRTHVTIFGTGHATKTKENERFLNPRQRILGSVAWGGFADSIVIIEPKDLEDSENGERIIQVMARNAESVKIELVFDSTGKLVERCDGAGEMLMDRFLLKFKPGEEIPVSTFMDYGTEIKMPKRTIQRWLAKQCEDGKLERVHKGLYRKTNPN